MKPKKHRTRTPAPGMDPVTVADVKKLLNEVLEKLEKTKFVCVLWVLFLVIGITSNLFLMKTVIKPISM